MPSPELYPLSLHDALPISGQFSAEDVGFATAPDWVRAILTHPARPPGRSFGYSSGGSHLLSAILATATGTSVLDYARAKLFDPDRKSTRLNSSHPSISYAVPRALPSFPTRRSSDLRSVQC